MNPTNTTEPLFLGDGVYIALERGMIKLTTSDGVEVTNTIYLEESVALVLIDFLLKSNWLSHAKPKSPRPPIPSRPNPIEDIKQRPVKEGED